MNKAWSSTPRAFSYLLESVTFVLKISSLAQYPKTQIQSHKLLGQINLGQSRKRVIPTSFHPDGRDWYFLMANNKYNQELCFHYKRRTTPSNVMSGFWSWKPYFSYRVCFCITVGVMTAGIPISYIADCFDWFTAFMMINLVCVAVFFILNVGKNIKASFLQQGGGPPKLAKKAE